MLKELLLFTLAILPIILLGCYVYKKDKNREPVRILIKLFCGGLLAAILTVIVTYVIQKYFPYFNGDYENFSSVGIFIYSFFIVALVEEVCKWIMLYLFSYHDKDFDELYDMIVYAVFVALGFAWIENLLYVYDGGVTTAIMRIFLAVPSHVSMGIFMGYFLSMAKLADINNKTSMKKKYIILSIVVPFIVHGIYDYCLFTANVLYIFVFLVFIVVLYIKAYKKIKFLSSLKTNLIISYCPSCGKKLDQEENFCNRCGNKIKG